MILYVMILYVMMLYVMISYVMILYGMIYYILLIVYIHVHIYIFFGTCTHIILYTDYVWSCKTITCIWFYIMIFFCITWYIYIYLHTYHVSIQYQTCHLDTSLGNLFIQAHWLVGHLYTLVHVQRWMLLRQARQIDDGARELRAASGQLVDGQGYVMTSVVDNDLLVSPTGTW